MSSKLFNETIHNAHRIATCIMHLPPEIARRVAYRVSPQEFEQLKCESVLRERITFPRMRADGIGYMDIRVLGIKALADPELTVPLPVLKDYGSSG